MNTSPEALFAISKERWQLHAIYSTSPPPPRARSRSPSRSPTRPKSRQKSRELSPTKRVAARSIAAIRDDAIRDLDIIEAKVREKIATMDIEAVTLLESTLPIRQKAFGKGLQLWDATKRLVELCNDMATEFIAAGENYTQAVELMTRAEMITSSQAAAEYSWANPKIRLQLRATTMRNLGVYFQRVNKLRSAQQYVQKALKIYERSLPDAVIPHSLVLLDMCAILSKLGKHDEALRHAQSALQKLHARLIKDLISDSHAAGEVKEMTSVMAVAYYNLAVEQEHLSMLDSCLSTYKKGVDVATEHLGADHSIALMLQEASANAEKQIESRRVRAQKRLPALVVTRPGTAGALQTEKRKLRELVLVASPVTLTVTPSDPMVPLKEALRPQTAPAPSNTSPSVTLTPE